MSTTKKFTVEGMHCQGCVNAVTAEVSVVDGVENVDVDLDSGRLSVTGADVDDAAVRAAVDEAGYQVR